MFKQGTRHKINLLKLLTNSLTDAIIKNNQNEILENTKRIAEIIVSLKVLYLSQIKKEQQKSYINMYKQIINLLEAIREAIHNKDYLVAIKLINKLQT
ncbi:MAG: hypothetical protein AB1571_03030 [Nanoarchaeota archaeon]